MIFQNQPFVRSDFRNFDVMKSRQVILHSSNYVIPADYFERFKEEKDAKAHALEFWPTKMSPPVLSFAGSSWSSAARQFGRERIVRGMRSWMKPNRTDPTRVDGAEMLPLAEVGEKTQFAERVVIFCDALAATCPNLREMASVGGLRTIEAYLMRYDPTPHGEGVYIHNDGDKATHRIASLIMCVSAPTGMTFCTLFLFTEH